MIKMIDEFNRGKTGVLPSKNSENFFIGFSFLGFKILFLVILSVWLLRLGINSSSSPMPFTDFLNMIKSCPNYYNNVVSFLKQNITYTGSTDSVVVPILGDFLKFLGNIWNILVYVFGAIWSAFNYLFWIFSSVFV